MILLFLPRAYHLIGWSCLRVDVLSQNVVFLIGKFWASWLCRNQEMAKENAANAKLLFCWSTCHFLTFSLPSPSSLQKIQEGARDRGCPSPSPFLSPRFIVIRLSQSPSPLISVSLSRSHIKNLPLVLRAREKKWARLVGKSAIVWSAVRSGESARRVISPLSQHTSVSLRMYTQSWIL